MYNDDRKRNNIIIFVLCLIMTAAVTFILGRKFSFVLSSNDDVLLRSIASGNYTGKPEAHLIYIMYPLGLIFKGLYSVLPNVYWYDGIMTALHMLCVFLISFRMGWVFERLSNKIVGSVVSFGMMIMFDAMFIAEHQYTLLAGVCAATAILWAATVKNKSNNAATNIIVIFLLLVSLWLRKQMFFLALPLLAMAIVFKIFDRKETVDERFEYFRDSLPPCITFVVLVVLSFVIEAVAYSGDDWKAFKDYNEARTEVYDYNKLPDFYDNPAFYLALGVSEDEYTALREYDVLLTKDIGTDEFTAFANQADEIDREWKQYYSVPRKVINETVNAMYGLNNSALGIAVTLTFFVLLFFFLVKDDKFAGFLVLASYAYEWLFVGYFTYLGRLPERITHGFYMMEMCFLVAMFVIVIGKERPVRQPSLFWQIVMSLFVVFILGTNGLNVARQALDSNLEAAGDADKWLEINAYFKSCPDNVYVLNTSVGASKPAYMFKEAASEAFNLVRAGNWAISSPVESQHESRLLGRPVYEALAKDDNVYYVMAIDKPVDWLETAFGTVTLKDTITLSSGEEYGVYRLKK